MWCSSTIALRNLVRSDWAERFVIGAIDVDLSELTCVDMSHIIRRCRSSPCYCVEISTGRCKCQQRTSPSLWVREISHHFEGPDCFSLNLTLTEVYTSISIRGVIQHALVVISGSIWVFYYVVPKVTSSSRWCREWKYESICAGIANIFCLTWRHIISHSACKRCWSATHV